MQISVSSTLTVYHDGQFWVGLAEHVEDGRYGAARIVFDAEPLDAQGALARSRLGRHAKRKPPNRRFGGCYSRHFADGFALWRRRNNIGRYSTVSKRKLRSQFPLSP